MNITNRIAIDTNVLVYVLDKEDSQKKKIANQLINLHPAISTQVVSEFINTARRLLPISKQQVILKCNQLFKLCNIIPVSQKCLELAENLIHKYDFQIFDAIIVATALENDFQILYSEDMHDELLVMDQLRIINPFSEGN